MEAIKFAQKIIISENSETIFDYTQDYGHRLTWDTFLKRAELIEGAIKAGKGVKSILRRTKWPWYGDRICNVQQTKSSSY